MGPGVPNSSHIRQLGGSVTAWCWSLADSGRFLAEIARVLGLMYGFSTCANMALYKYWGSLVSTRWCAYQALTLTLTSLNPPILHTGSRKIGAGYFGLGFIKIPGGSKANSRRTNAKTIKRSDSECSVVSCTSVSCDSGKVTADGEEQIITSLKCKCRHSKIININNKNSNNNNKKMSHHMF